MKDILKFLGTEKPTKPKSTTPITDGAEEKWGARRVVDADVARQIEERFNQAQAYVDDIATQLEQWGGEITLWGKGLMNRLAKQAAQIADRLTPVETAPIATQTATTASSTVTIQNVTPPEAKDRFTQRVEEYVKKQKQAGKTVTVRKIQNSFSPYHPRKESVIAALEQVGYQVPVKDIGIVLTK